MVGTAVQLNGDHETLPGSQAYSLTIYLFFWADHLRQSNSEITFFFGHMLFAYARLKEHSQNKALLRPRGNDQPTNFILHAVG